MAGPHSITPHDLDRELADALRTEPSGEFRARIRARVDGEKMNVGWRLPQPAAYAGFAGVIVAAAIWFMPYGAAPVRQASNEAPATAVGSTETVSTGEAPHPMMRAPDSSRTLRRAPALAVTARTTKSAAALANEPTASATAADVSSGPEVLLSESERAGVQLLLESAASGRLRLPEEMLRDLSLPIVEARTAFPDPDAPWVTVEGAVQ